MSVFRSKIVCAGATLAIGVSLGAVEALAGGFTFPELGSKAVGRGGAYMLGANGPEVIALNPALLTRLDGSKLTLDLHLHSLEASFARAGENPNAEVDGTGFEPVEEELGLFPEPMFFASSDFGLDDLGFGIGIYGPNAVGRREFPEDGAQRFQLIKSNLLEINFVGAAAWHWEGLSLGASFGVASIDTEFTTVTSGALGAPNENPDDDTQTNISVSDVKPTGIVGVAYDLMLGDGEGPRSSVSVGLSYEIPIDIEGEGTAKLTFGPTAANFNARLKDDAATFDSHEAGIVRASARYGHVDGGRELFDVELMATFEQWSEQKEFVVKVVGPVLLDIGNSTIESEIAPTIIPKKWDDTVSVRLGGDLNLHEMFTVRVGGFTETAAVPSSTSNVDFLSFNRLGVGLGASVYLGWADIDLGYMFIQNEDRTVTDGEVLVVAPLSGSNTKIVANNGDYKSSYQTLTVGMTFHFGADDVVSTTPEVR